MSEKKDKKIIEQILKLEAEVIVALSKKSNKTKEINIQSHREKINKLKSQLTK